MLIKFDLKFLVFFFPTNFFKLFVVFWFKQVEMRVFLFYVLPGKNERSADRNPGKSEKM